MSNIKTERAFTFVIYKDATGEFRWSLKAPNYRTIADSSESYKRKKPMMRMIGKIMEAGGHNFNVLDKS